MASLGDVAGEERMTTSGLTPQEAVAALPRRTAHALHALLEVEHDPSLEGGPFLASEVVVYDEEALTARSTAAALRAAQRLGLAVCAGGYWTPTFRAYDLRGALEERYLEETSRSGDA